MAYKDQAIKSAYDRAYRERPERRAAELERNCRRRPHRQSPSGKSEEKKRWLGRRYGLTVDDVSARLLAQGGVCAMCGKAEWGKTGPCVDHDHKTGRIRGILCHKCNAAAGLIKDDPKIALKMSEYLS
jgi:hypothetical protein